MKIKDDFITNSSSANFIILKKFLTQEQIIAIYNHLELGKVLAKKYKHSDAYTPDKNDEWLIYETKKELRGETSMDNFDMKWFLREIYIDEKIIRFKDHC
jgi:hypothetical protein